MGKLRLSDGQNNPFFLLLNFCLFVVVLLLTPIVVIIDRVYQLYNLSDQRDTGKDTINEGQREKSCSLPGGGRWTEGARRLLRWRIKRDGL